ncbi:hypothetical protein [Prescottella agglutinans]|uniref:Uncharacterized protein n=1 Tax=Prescottella agglutinans TaxID=1644129 RepID=A0ABT6MER2_9NOCA|nr:hypothetical protein [Prescottella agglutinans]MDH6282812.1 hypothetical protein [Prescottella agglutinans]
MSALMDEELHPVFVKRTPQEATASRLRASKVLAEVNGNPDFRLPVSPVERRLYLDAGLEPPTE